MSTSSIKSSLKHNAARLKGRTTIDRSPSSDGVTWGPIAAVLVVVFLYFVVQIIGALVVSIYPMLRHWSSARATDWLNNSATGQFIFVFLVEILTVLGLWWFIRFRKGRFASIGLGKASRKDPLYSLLGFAIYFPIYIAVVSFLSRFIHSFNVNQSQALGFSQSTTGWPLIIVFFSLVLLPAVVEEILFRGFLYSGLKKALPVVWAAGLTSLLFASPHLLESNSGGALWIAGVDTFILSLVLCWLREKTGRLYAGMGLHALKNFLAFASLFLFHVH